MASLGDLFITVGAKLDGFRQAMGEVKSSVASAARDAQYFGTALTAGMTLPLVGVGTAALKVAGELEQNSIAFKTLLGSADKASQHLEQLRAFAMTTPFQFSDLTLASKRMQALGFDAKQVIPILTNVGDAAAALGMGAEGVQRIITALGQMRAKGMVQAEEMRQLAEAGIPAWDILAKKLNTDVAGAMKAVEKRTVEASEAIPAILAGMNAKFGGLMAQQSKTLLGQWSNIKDQISFTLADVGNTLAPIAKNLMDKTISPMLDHVKALAKAFAELPEPMRNAAIAATGFLAAIGPAMFVVGGVTSGVIRLAAALATMGPALLNPITLGILAVAAAGGVLYYEFGRATEKVTSLDKAFVDFLTKMVGNTKDFAGARDKLDAALANNAISVDGYNKLLAMLEDREKKALGAELSDQFGLHLKIIEDGAKKAAISAEKLKEAFKDLGIKDTRLELTEASAAFTLLRSSGHLTFQQMLEGAAHIRKLRDELEAFKKVQLVPGGRQSGPSFEELANLPLIFDLGRLPQIKKYTDFTVDSLVQIGNELELTQRNADITAAAFHDSGEKTGAELQKLAESAGENYRIMRADGTATADALERAWIRWQRAMNEADFAFKRITKEEHDAREINLKDNEERIKSEEKAKKVIVNHRYELSRELEQMSRRTFDSMERDLARNIVQWKGWSDTIKNVGRGFAEDFLQIMFKGLFKPLEDQFAKIAAKIGGWLGGILGNGGTTAASIPGTDIGGGWGGGGSSGGGGVGGGGASSVGGVLGAVGAISSAVSAVSGVIGNFQMMGMNKSLDVLVNHTLVTANELQNIRRDAWDQWNRDYFREGEILNAIQALGNGRGATFDFRGSTFTGVSQQQVDAFMQAAYRKTVLALG